MKDWITSG